jgi:4-diphosphocytidyl-2-C-methyl-D-erythritol kinase
MDRIKVDSLSFASYAKINLGLLLLSKRNDGYHDIVTVFQQISLHDDIVFRKTERDIHITCSDPMIPSDDNNLIWQAFQLFRTRARIRKGIDVQVKKRIPSGAGLGGGSSNAAVTLLAANQLWRKPFSSDQLKEMACEIGSDVPFFLLGGTALGCGRGEILSPLLWGDKWWILLVCPGIHVSTSWAYKRARITLTKQEKFTKFKSIFNTYIPRTLRSDLINELEGVVFKRHPALRTIKEKLFERDAFYASMSGSGASVYGLFSQKEKVEKAKMFFDKKKNMKTFVCRPIYSRMDQAITTGIARIEN